MTVRKIFYLALLLPISFIFGSIAVALGHLFGLYFMLPLILLLIAGILFRKIGGPRCILCGKKLPKGSALIDYCIDCAKKREVKGHEEI